MNNSHIRLLVASFFPGVALKSYSDKLSCTNVYRFSTQGPSQTESVLEKIKTHQSSFPAEIKYFQIYGIDSNNNSGAVIHIGTNETPSFSSLFLEPHTLQKL